MMSKGISLQISHSALSQLQTTKSWLSFDLAGGDGFTAEDVYGPGGKLGWLWTLSWTGPYEMRADLCTNMGGGVPIEVIDTLVLICADEACHR